DFVYDAAGGRHMTYIGTSDGCPNGDHAVPGPGLRPRVCIVYRAATPNGDFRPRTILVEVNPATRVAAVAIGTPRHVRVGAGRDGQGWVVWQSSGDDHIRMTPTRDDTATPVTKKHTINLKPLPNGECANTNSLRVQATVGGPSNGRPKIQRVAWSLGR